MILTGKYTLESLYVTTFHMFLDVSTSLLISFQKSNRKIKKRSETKSTTKWKNLKTSTKLVMRTRNGVLE